MDSDIVSMMESDIAAAVVDVSATLKWAAVEVQGTAGALGQEDDIEPEGVASRDAVEFVAAKSAFTGGVPPAREVVELDGVKYWVKSVTDDEAGITLSLRIGE